MNIFKPILKIMWSIVGKADQKRIDSQYKPTGLQEVNHIPYVNDGNKYHLLDVYYPKNSDKKLPVIIDVHGGGWLYGDKELNKYYCLELAKRGFCVFNLSYRLAIDDDILIIHQLEDLFCAYNWIDENMSDFPADRNNVFLTGDSAGGHFVCLSSAININDSLLSKYNLKSNNLKFKCIGATSPVIDLVSPNVTMNVNLPSLLGNNIKSSPYYELMKFDNIATSTLPPFYISTASGDFVEKQANDLHKLLDNLNVENMLHDWKQKVNGKKLPHVFSVVNPFSGPAITTIDEMTNYFKQYIS